MPTYEVTNPEGKTLQIEGTRPPTADELRDIFQKTNVEPAGPGFLSSLGKAMVEPLGRYGAMTGEALAQSGRILTDPTYRNIVQKTNMGQSLTPEEAKNVLGRRETYMMKPESMQDFNTLGSGLFEGSKRSAGAAAYAIPMGAGTTASFRAAHPIISAGIRGGIIGGLSGYGGSKKGQELGSTALGGLLGYGMGAGMQYAGQKLQKPVQELTQKAKNIYKEKVATPVSKTAARIYSNIFQLSKRKATRDMDPFKTAQDLMNLTDDGFYPNDWDDFVTRSGEAAKVLTDMTDDAAAANPQPIDVNSVTQKAREQMQNKLGFDAARQNKVISDIGLAIPDNMNVGPTANLGPSQTIGINIDPQTMNITDLSSVYGTKPANIGNITPKQALQLERQLQAQAADYRRAYLQNKTPENKVLRDTLNSAALEMKKLLDRSFAQGQQQAIEQVKTPERIAALNNAIPGLGDKVAQNVTSLSQLRATNAPLVQGLFLARETENQLSRIFQQTGTRLASQVVGGLAGSSAYGPIGLIGGMTLGPSLMEPLATYARSKVAVPIAGQAARAVQQASSGGLQAGMQQGSAGLLNALSRGLQSPAVQTGAIQGSRSIWNALGGGKYGSR